MGCGLDWQPGLLGPFCCSIAARLLRVRGCSAWRLLRHVGAWGSLSGAQVSPCQTASAAAPWLPTRVKPTPLHREGGVLTPLANREAPLNFNLSFACQFPKRVGKRCEMKRAISLCRMIGKYLKICWLKNDLSVRKGVFAVKQSQERCPPIGVETMVW